VSLLGHREYADYHDPVPFRRTSRLETKATRYLAEDEFEVKAVDLCREAVEKKKAQEGEAARRAALEPLSGPRAWRRFAILVVASACAVAAMFIWRHDAPRPPAGATAARRPTTAASCDSAASVATSSTASEATRAEAAGVTSPWPQRALANDDPLAVLERLVSLRFSRPQTVATGRLLEDLQPAASCFKYLALDSRSVVRRTWDEVVVELFYHPPELAAGFARKVRVTIVRCGSEWKAASFSVLSEIVEPATGHARA
jgi:hypothetical protein